MPLGQTITVVNKSGKVVKSSKVLVNVFKEAQSAYREKKAEIKAVRNANLEEKQNRLTVENLTINEGATSRGSSRASSRRSSVTSTTTRPRHSRPKPPVERGYSDSFFTNDGAQSPGPTRPQQRSYLRFDQDLDGSQGVRGKELVRRHTDGMASESSRPRTSRSASMSDIDMDLAYGEIPPPLPVRRYNEENELRSQMTKLQILLDEAHCVQHSVIATIENLQKNPDALAAVALTLGEISNIASKMAPGALTAMKGAFPMVVAILASPEFMIAAGVGIGVTVIALGGYKIIKKIRQRKADGKDEDKAEFDELQELGSDLSRIEIWRRGIAEADNESLGTSVEGEFVTPAAGRQLISDGVIRKSDLKSTKSDMKPMRRSMRNPKSPKATESESSGKEKKRSKKESSGLKMLFKSNKTTRQPRLEPALV